MIMPLAKKTTTSHNQTTANFFTLIGKTTTQTAVNIKTSFDSSPDEKSQLKKNYISIVITIYFKIKTESKVVSALILGFCLEKPLVYSLLIKLSGTKEKYQPFCLKPRFLCIV